jgi:hypothetical protein
MSTEVSTRTRGKRPAPARRHPGPDRRGLDRRGAGRAGLSPPGAQQAVARPAPGAAPSASARSAGALQVPRTRFILLVLGLLGGGLVCLLVINTTLAAASFRISALQQGNVALAQREQALQQQVTAEEAPSSLQKQALKLGMRTQPRINVINLRTGRVYRAPATLPGIPNVPGYAP